MNSCFDKFVGFKRIISDRLNRVVIFKKRCTFSNFIKITQKNVIFSYLIKPSKYWGKFQSSYETKKIFYRKDNETKP